MLTSTLRFSMGLILKLMSEFLYSCDQNGTYTKSTGRRTLTSTSLEISPLGFAERGTPILCTPVDALFLRLNFMIIMMKIAEQRVPPLLSHTIWLQGSCYVPFPPLGNEDPHFQYFGVHNFPHSYKAIQCRGSQKFAETRKKFLAVEKNFGFQHDSTQWSDLITSAKTLLKFFLFSARVFAMPPTMRN